mmetsp:Transcript_35722/g.107939  ORF Transcript_35722/g.107939 Transcript_35722/m.107939 type:complete len:238 (+) Transcript_35722:193-906(+)
MTPCRIKYTKKCMAAMHHRNLFFNIRSHVDSFSSESSSGAALSAPAAWAAAPSRSLAAWCSSAEGKPSFSGESLMTHRVRALMASAMTPGTRMPHRQPKDAATLPARSGMQKPPMLLEAFQPLHHLPRVTAGNQFTSIFPHGVPPQPWKRPLATQKNVNQGTVLPIEKPMLHKPVSIIPREKISTGDPRRSDKTPAMNLEFMYAKGKMELTAPNCNMLKPRSFLMIGPTNENDKRVK